MATIITIGAEIPAGSQNRWIHFPAVDVTDGITAETGLSGFSVFETRRGQTSVEIITPTIEEVDATNQPGVYRLLATLETETFRGILDDEISLTVSHASIANVLIRVRLFRSTSFPIPGENALTLPETHTVGSYGYDLIHTVMESDGRTPLDVSSYVVAKQLAILPPDEESETLVAAAFTTDGTDGKISYTVSNGFWNRPGNWRRQARVEKSGAVYRDPPIEFTIVDMDGI